jgi:tetratricopeptide (TPR) repeat protein
LSGRRQRRSSRDGGICESISNESEPSVGGEGADESKVAEGEANAENLGVVVDVQGDRDITRYGANQYEVPAYRRTGSGLVVGLTDERIDYESRHENTLITLPANTVAASQPRPLSTIDLHALYPTFPIPIANRRPLIIPANAAAESSSTAFPPGLGIASSAADFNTGTPCFIALFPSEEDEDETISEESIEHKVDPAIREAEILRRNAELNRAVEQNPQDIRAWMCLAEHQEHVILGMRHDNRALNDNEKQLVASASLSIYEKALKANPQHPERDCLILGRIEQGAKVWDPEQLSRQWEQVLRYDSESIGVWIEYLDYCQTDSQKFDFDTCFKSYLHCLKTHSSVGRGPDKCLIRSYLFLRATLFLREAGYIELAVGYWQAVLEFVVFRPADLAYDHKKALKQFEKFWSPAYVKIGEPNWRPWNAGYDPFAPKAVVANPGYNLWAYPPDLFKTWAAAERERMMRNRMPSHEIEPPTKEEGVFEVFLLADCKHILQCFCDLAEQNGVALLIDSFLQFCHLPHLTNPANLHTSRLWTGDNFVRNQFMDDWRNTISKWIKFHDYAASTTVQPFAFSHHTFIPTTDTLFSDPECWFSALAKWAASASRRSCVIKSGFVVETLYSLAKTFKDSNFVEYTLAVSFACNSDRARQHAKGLLRQRPGDLRLWNALALMDWRTGNWKMARDVWSNALEMSQGFDDYEFIESSLLWNSWIWETIHNGHFEKSAYLLQAMPYKRVDLLSYHKAYENELNRTNVLRLTRVSHDPTIDFGELIPS